MTLPMRLPIFDQRLALRGVDPRFAEASAFADDPAGAVVASAPSTDSILFPRQPSAGILTPEDRAMLKRNAILQVAASLLQAGGRSPNQRGTLANIGTALAGLDLPGAAQSALRMRAVTDELRERSNARDALKDISRRYPVLPGATPEERYQQLTNIVTEAATVPGLEDWVGKMSNVLAQTKPAKQGRLIRSVEIDQEPGSPTYGRPIVLFRDPETGDVVTKGSEAQGMTPYQLAMLGLATEGANRADATELKASALGANMARSHLAMKAIEDADPAAVEEVSAIVRGGRVAGAVPVVGPVLDEAIRAGKAPALSPAARQLLANLNSFVAAAVPDRGGQALTFIETKLFMDEFVRDPGDDPETARVKIQNRIGRIREAKVKGRRAWRDALDTFGINESDIFGSDQPSKPKTPTARPAAPVRPRSTRRADPASFFSTDSLP